MRRSYLIVLLACLYMNSHGQLGNNPQVMGIHDQDSKLNYQYDHKSKLFYHISNNENEVVVRIAITDEMLKRKILMFGCTTWIDPNGKGKKRFGVKYPMGQNPGEGAGMINSQPGNNDRPPMNSEIDKMLLQPSNIELIGFLEKNSSQMVSPEKSKCVKADMHFNNQKDMFIAVRIPFNMLKANRNKPLDELSIQIITGAMVAKKQMGSQGLSGQRPPRSGSGMSPRGGGRRPNMDRPRGSERPDFREMMSETSLMIKKYQVLRNGENND